MSKKIEDNNLIENKYRKLDDLTHILLRPGMYIGSIKPHTSIKYFINDDKKMEPDEVTFNPGFLKIFDEIVTNSVDESKREGSKLSIIKVTVDNSKIIIHDNGGIPVVIHGEHKEWIPEMIFSNLKAGSNFNDQEQRTTGGLNGVGSVLTNVFSKEFTVSTCDGKNSFHQTFSNNMRERTTPVIKKSTKNHTEISFIPDLEKFNLTEIDDAHFKLIKKRVFDIAGTNPHLKVYFNNEILTIKSFEDYIKTYSDEYIYDCEKDGWSFGVMASKEGFQQVSFVNCIETYDGGSHVDYILNQITNKLREFFKKKHKVDVKPSDIKNHLFIFLNSIIINPSFSSQTKEKLITEVKDYGYQFTITDKVIARILKSEIVQSILDWIEQKKKADENKLARELNKSLGKVKVEKLVDAKSKDRWKCSLCIFEGDSAANGARKFRDSQIVGSFALKGKFINVSEIPTSKLVQNTEAVNLMASIGLKLGEKVDRLKMRYGKIIIYTDQDFDGYSITALLINFFNKYWPELFEYKMIYKAETPIVVATNMKNKKNVIKFYTQDDYLEWEKTIAHKDWDVSYKKGLSALTPDEYSDIINNPRLTILTKDELSDTKLDIWFGGSKTVDLRKMEIIK